MGTKPANIDCAIIVYMASPQRRSEDASRHHCQQHRLPPGSRCQTAPSAEHIFCHCHRKSCVLHWLHPALGKHFPAQIRSGNSYCVPQTFEVYIRTLRISLHQHYKHKTKNGLQAGGMDPLRKAFGIDTVKQYKVNVIHRDTRNWNSNLGVERPNANARERQRKGHAEGAANHVTGGVKAATIGPIQTGT
eukprot:365665-Chlamydomonas_euryale.AAC.12